MSDNTILKQVLKNLGQIAAETGKEAVVEAGKVTESIITGKELLGDIKPLTEQELAQKRAEDSQKIQQEMGELRRNVGGEIEQVRREDKQEEEQKEQEFLENLKRQREAEEAERQQLNSMNTGKKRRHGPSGPQNKRKSQQPDPASMSQTGEMTGGKID